MKLYLVYGDGVKVFNKPNEVAQFLTNQQLNRKNISHFIVTEIEAQIQSEFHGNDYLTNFQSELALESTLDIVLGDDYGALVKKLKSIIEHLSKDGPQKTAFLKKLEITPYQKSNISKLLSSHQNFILYEVPICLEDSVEYYKIVLQLHGFRKISDKFVREIYTKSGYLHSRGYCVTPDRVIESFNKAKSK